MQSNVRQSYFANAFSELTNCLLSIKQEQVLKFEKMPKKVDCGIKCYKMDLAGIDGEPKPS